MVRLSEEEGKRSFSEVFPGGGSKSTKKILTVELN
jgi:hypothetical protein